MHQNGTNHQQFVKTKANNTGFYHYQVRIPEIQNICLHTRLNGTITSLYITTQRLYI